ncbi:MAG TPA: hypothetical protein VNH22_20085 [Blastocatellia bacterium]|jgi:thermostable 8-oxoguanine DNA glycosylase|nr:hypothetical protein [Blastocatellia bacterium]
MKSINSSIERLLHQRLGKTVDPAQDMIGTFSHIKHRAYFTRPEFLLMCRWKSPRPRRLYESNSPAEIRRASIDVFASDCEKGKAELLTSLRGVGLPTASAILTLTDPQNYGVIDIRVWQLLYDHEVVANRPSGTGFSIDDWLEYLQALRFWARKFKATARAVEIVLFDYHKEKQEGRLYATRSALKDRAVVKR